MAQNKTLNPGAEPLILIVPGINSSDPQHWQSRWEEQRDDCARVELGMWEKPQRNVWVNQLNLAIHTANRPLILVAHSFGCYAVAWWLLERPEFGQPVVGALLVAPPDVDSIEIASPLASFAPTPPVIDNCPQKKRARSQRHYEVPLWQG